ncbi:MAG: hypothetical protein AAGN46_02995 [Acidobacteriota bacterium]
MENRLFWLVLVVLIAGAALLVLQPSIEESVLPSLETAWVAIEVEGDPVARVDRVEIAAGTPFTLHAVVGARRDDAAPWVYYTDAERLAFADGAEVAADRLKPWSRSRPVQVRWYTVEGRAPFVSLAADGEPELPRMDELLRADWPNAWSVAGTVASANDDHLADATSADDTSTVRRSFGTQRFHARVEIYEFEDDLLPRQTIASAGVSELIDDPASFPTVVALLPGPSGPASAVFGLPQVGLPPAPAPELAARVAGWADDRLTFTLSSVLRDQLAAADRRYADLDWRITDLGGETRWSTGDGPGAAAGDLLRVGDRVVVLHQDRGVQGVLDYDDLAFDYVRGAEIRALHNIWSGEGLAVEITSLAASAAARSPTPAAAADPG